MTLKQQHTDFVKSSAIRQGFEYCGISRAELLSDDARRLESWLNHGYQGKMEYMSRNFDLRIDPSKLVPGAKSVITLLMNYFPSQVQDPLVPRVSKYAYGKDYHLVIREKLNGFLRSIRENIGEVTGRGFVDSAPVLERSWAVKSGLGWIGKNGNLISKDMGSFFFIATLITDLDLQADHPYLKDYCGTCTRCVDDCPTGAILPDKVIDGSRCISYYTIELKDALLPSELKGKMDDYLFGCDTCQDVCPWNRFSKPHDQKDFSPLPEILHFRPSDWEDLTEESFKVIFRDSPLKRTKFQGIKRNLSLRESPNSNKGED